MKAQELTIIAQFSTFNLYFPKGQRQMIKTRWSCRWITSQRCSPSTPQFSSLSGPARNHQLLSGFFLVISIISPTYKQFHDRSRCHLELELHSDQFGFSVFTEEMNFEQTKGCHRDYYQFGRWWWWLMMVLPIKPQCWYDAVSNVVESGVHSRSNFQIGSDFWPFSHCNS